jgi:hypothetical protein
MRKTQISSTNKPPFERPTTSQALQGHNSTMPLLVVTVSSHALTMSANEDREKWF